MATYDVDALRSYVEQNKDVLVKAILFGGEGGDTIANLTKQLGIKTSEDIHILDNGTSIQDGKGCGFNADGKTALTQRTIETALMKVNQEWCPDELLGKYAEYLVRVGANANAENMSFEDEIFADIVADINKAMEKKVWEGQKGTDLIDGFVTLAAADASTVKVSIPSGTSVYNAIKAVIMAIPEDIIDEATVFVAPAVYRAFVQEMVEKNYYHYESGKVEANDLIFPGTNIAVHKTLGMTGDKRNIYASAYGNMFYGCDAMSDKEEFRAWFSDDDDLFRLKVKWNAGVQTAFPDEVVLGSADSDLV